MPMPPARRTARTRGGRSERRAAPTSDRAPGDSVVSRFLRESRRKTDTTYVVRPMCTGARVEFNCGVTRVKPAAGPQPAGDASHPNQASPTCRSRAGRRMCHVRGRSRDGGCRQADGLHDHRQFVRTRRKRFGAICRRTSSRSWNWSSAAGPTGSNRRAAREFAATSSSSRVITTAATTQEATSSFPSTSIRANISRSTRWSASRAASPTTGLFSHLKAVYLFGCNTLNPVALRSAPEEIARTLVRVRPLAGGRRTSRARDEPALCRQQPRSHAAHLQERSGDLRLFVGRPARAGRRRPISTAIFSRAVRAKLRAESRRARKSSATFRAIR